MKDSYAYFIVGHIYIALSIFSQDLHSKVILLIIGLFVLILGYSMLKMENNSLKNNIY